MTANMKTEVRVAHLRPDQVERYEQLHRNIAPGNEKHMREAGIVSLRIYRDGQVLLMIVESDPTLAIPDRVINHQLEEEWHHLTGNCFSKSWQDASEVYRLQKEDAKG
ncbi:L-rhamnose mutarotase [Cohnella endophytica]|uniref:L-rhamnose mutarotase n=1 Tax=Cohnella endophytica TaxID=2419778 RepID=A0A494XV05_9BACL|nr:L-rhamnose mutarotase [Cohnella endophytica]RKP54398.1 L-rhamnose mutarotase [Cohnella endophytica]